LNAIIGFTGTLLMRLPGPLTAEQAKQLLTVQTSAKHLLSLINDLLDLAKVESGNVEIKLEPVVCGAVLEEVASTLRPLADKKGLGFAVVLTDEDIIVRTDRRILSQIAINLVNNALKYTDTGGVKLSLGRHVGPEGAVTTVAVEDSGCGIGAEEEKQLFRAFTQLDSSSTRQHEGTGLGLYLSQMLASLIGGTITCESELGRGSVFTLTIPDN
jgi:protein-histidine pros-kinase